MNERQTVEIKTLAARGIIADAVSRLAVLLLNRRTPGAEEMRLQDLFLRHTQEYVHSTRGGPGALQFMVPDYESSIAPAENAVGQHPVDLDEQARLQSENDLVNGLKEIANTLPVGRPKVVAAN